MGTVHPIFNRVFKRYFINFAPKNFAEVLNRVVAHATAYEDLGFGSKGIQTAEDMMRFKSLGNSLYINMDATGMSRLQTSETAKVLTQFWSANARWWETVLRDTNLTRSERWRIGAGVLALTGGAGIIGINNTRKVIDRVKDIYNYFDPEEDTTHFTEKEMSWVERTFERGILAWVSDNYDWSDAIALPFTDLLDNVTELFDKPLEAVPSLAVLDRQTELVKDLYRSAYVIRHSNDSYGAWKAALKIMATSKGLPSATKQRLTAAILWNQGMKWNTKGQLTQEDAAQLDAVMALIGVPRMEATDISAAFVSNQHEAAKVKEFVEETKRYWNIWKDTRDEGVWALWTTLLHNAPLTDAQKIAAEKELLKSTEYDTVITDGGDNLSAGQKQLLCIARIMLLRPPMMILDEATSNIDTRTEMKIQEALNVMMEGRTCFIVAHRLSTIRDADEILVMDRGHIIERGTHDELMKLDKVYAGLIKTQ